MAEVERRLPHGATLHLERFAPRTSADGNTASEVELRCSGRTLTVPADSTVLAAVRAELPNTAYSLRAGFPRDLPTAGAGGGDRPPGRTAHGCGGW